MPRHRFALLTSLYAAQGLPYGFFTLVLPAVLREAGWSLTALSLLHFLALPWALKFLWAPAVDQRGARRSWLLGLQGVSIGLALALAWADLAPGSVALLAAVLLFNALAATQDIVTDGLAVRWLAARERGLANAIQVGAYRLGMVVGGGGLLWLYAQTSWPVVFTVMAGLLVLTTLPVWRMAEPERPPVSPAPVAPTTGASRLHLAWGWLHRAMTPGMLSCAALIFCFRFGDQMVSGVVIPFLRDQGVDKASLALMKGGVGSMACLAGAAVSGWWMMRVPRRDALLWTGLAQSLFFGLYIVVALGGGGLPWLWAATVIEGVVGTMATVALFALMMDASDPDHAGTDYTLLASVVVAVGSLGTLAGGLVGDYLGYVWAFGIGAVLSAVGCVALVRWLDRHPPHERVAQAWRSVSA